MHRDGLDAHLDVHRGGLDVHMDVHRDGLDVHRDGLDVHRDGLWGRKSGFWTCKGALRGGDASPRDVTTILGTDNFLSNLEVGHFKSNFLL